MLIDRIAGRRTRLDQDMGKLCYRRFALTRELEQLDQRIAQLEGAIAENDATGRDVQTEAVIDAAKTEQKGAEKSDA